MTATVELVISSSPSRAYPQDLEKAENGGDFSYPFRLHPAVEYEHIARDVAPVALCQTTYFLACLRGCK